MGCNIYIARFADNMLDLPHKIQVASGVESPQEAFKTHFPNYQIANYRGILLIDIFKSSVFRGYRRAGLVIEPTRTALGSITNMYKTKASSARRRAKKIPEFLQREAQAILTEVFPLVKLARNNTPELAEQCRLAEQELTSAFRNLGYLD